MKFDKSLPGNLTPTTSQEEDKVMRKYNGVFLGVVYINSKEYHIWGHIEDDVPILDEINILKDELAQAYNKIDELSAEIKKLKEKSVEDSWRGCVDRQGGCFDEFDVQEWRP